MNDSSQHPSGENAHLEEPESIDWWIRQLTVTRNCLQGGAFLIFCGNANVSNTVAAWFIAMSRMRVKGEGQYFVGTSTIVPSTEDKRDISNQISGSITSILSGFKVDEKEQKEALQFFSSHALAAYSCDDVERLINRLPERSAVAVCFAEKFRYDNIDLVHNSIPTYTGFNVNFTTDEALMCPHLYRLTEALLAIAVNRKHSIVIFAQTFTPVTIRIPEQLMQADALAILNSVTGGEFGERVNHLDIAERIRIENGPLAAIEYINKHILEPQEHALSICHFLGKNGMFSAAWQALIPQLEKIQQSAGADTLINVVQSAAAAGAYKEALSTLNLAWSKGVYSLEGLNAMALMARRLGASIWGEVVQRMRSQFPENTTTSSRLYEWLVFEENFSQAADVARKLGRKLDSLLCDIRAGVTGGWDEFFSEAAAEGQLEECVCRAVSLALERGSTELARDFIKKLPEVAVDEGRKVHILIEFLKKDLATADITRLTSQESILDQVFRYVAGHPHDTEARSSLLELFEVSLPEINSTILVGSRCLKAFAFWNESREQTADLSPDPMDDFENVGSGHRARDFVQAIYETGKPTLIGLGDLPMGFRGQVDIELLKELGILVSVAADKQDTDMSLVSLHAVSIVCRQLKKTESDYIAGLRLVGAFAHRGEFQKALNLAETMLVFWPDAQLESKGVRRAHGWAALADAYDRAQNPIAALLQLCLAFEAMIIAPAGHQPKLLQHKLRLTARVLRSVRLTEFGRSFLIAESLLMSRTNNRRGMRELTVMELSFRLAELDSRTTFESMNEILSDSINLLRDDKEVEWEPTVSCAASAIVESRKRGIIVPKGAEELLHSRLGRCKKRIQDIIRRHLIEKPSLLDIEAAVRNLDQADRSDDEGYQLGTLDGFLRRAIGAACDRNDGEAFIAAATLLSQPALVAARFRGASEPKMSLISPLLERKISDAQVSDAQLSDFAAATNLQTTEKEVSFSKLLWPLAAATHMVRPDEGFCFLAYDSSRNLCQLVVTQSGIDGPKRLPKSKWCAKKHTKWSRCFPDHYAWKSESNFGVVEERPREEAVKSSVRNLEVDIVPEIRSVTFLPEAELFGFPFIITNSNSGYLGNDLRCATAPSLVWLGNARQKPLKSTKRIDAWLGNPAKSHFDVLKVRDGLMGPIRDAGGTIHSDDTPGSLRGADVGIVLSHGSTSLQKTFGGISEGFGMFTIEDLAGWLGSCQSIIFFVCHAGRSDDKIHNQETFGLVGLLLRRNVRLVVAPPWPLNTDIPSVWLPAYLTGLNRGDDAETAAAAASKIVKLKYSHPCAWGAMQLFGDAAFKLTVHSEVPVKR